MRSRTFRERVVALGVSLLCIAAPCLGPATAYADVAVDRLAGADRYATMGAILDEVAKVGQNKTSVSAVLATGQNYPDALSATGLAGNYGPIVLTKGDTLSPEAKAQLQKMGAKTLMVVGGTSAISDNVLNQLSQMGLGGTRLSGTNRQETSFVSAVQTTINDSTPTSAVILATGKNFADALSIGPWAMSTATPILLVDDNGLLSKDMVDYVKKTPSIKTVIMLGGTGLVSAGVMDQLGDAYQYSRLAGADRYETSAMIAEFEALNGFGWTAPAIATGQNFADALSGSTLCCANHSPLLLVKDASGPTVDALKKHTADVKRLYVLGGESAVPTSVANGIAGVLNGTAASPSGAAGTGGAVTPLTDATFADNFAKGDKLVAIEFWTDTSQPSKDFMPIFEEVAREMSDKVNFFSCKVEQSPIVSVSFNVIEKFPCVLYFKNGKVDGRITGVTKKENLVTSINARL